MVASRQTGKSYALITIVTEVALQNPNFQIKYACPTAIMAQKIIIPTFRKIFSDCPDDLKPRYVRSEKCFYFANGSTIQIEGTDEGNSEKLRGTASHLCIVDEAAFMDDLKYLVSDILMPQTLTTGGKIIIVSTPPKVSEHDFYRFADEAKLVGSYIRKNILDILEDIKNDPPHFRDRLKPEIVEEMKQEVGGEMSDTWRREFLCESLKDGSKAVIPEFTDKLELEIVKQMELPPYYDSYESMDLGLKDFTGVLFAYIDFRNAKLVIEDEVLINLAKENQSTKTLSEAIRNKEALIWRDPISKTTKPVYLRIADDDLITLNDLDRLHGLKFLPTRKDDRESAINELRMKLSAGQIIISPKCKNLIYQLRTATWNKNRTQFERSEIAGHYDLVAALIYLVRNVQWNKNPYPTLWSFATNQDVFGHTSVKLSQAAETFKQIFSMKKPKPKQQMPASHSKKKTN